MIVFKGEGGSAKTIYRGAGMDFPEFRWPVSGRAPVPSVPLCCAEEPAAQRARSRGWRTLSARFNPDLFHTMNPSQSTRRQHRKKSPLTAEKLIRQMQKHPTLTAMMLGLVLAMAAAYVAVGMAN